MYEEIVDFGKKIFDNVLYCCIRNLKVKILVWVNLLN